MGLNQSAADAKRGEIRERTVRCLEECLSAQLAELPVDRLASAANEFLDSFVRITPPEEEEPRLHLITMSRLGENASSAKPGNVRLNIGNLINSAAAGTLTVAGVWTTPWLAPLAALVIWNDLRSRATVKLSEDEGCLIWAMWLNSDGNRTVADQDLLAIANEERARADLEPLDREGLSKALENLKTLQCIERSRAQPDRWCLREWVSVNY